VAVEDLVAGDEVSVMEHGRAVSRPVSWIGRQHRSIDSRHATPDAYPVRIRAGAFREEVPHRDLLVTAEHCVFVDGVLIPARMLVNGRSIVVDRSITAFDYFHLELERHGILVAEGLETESYLDTGNRGTFANGAGANGAASIDTRTWAEHAAAPLTVDRAAVEPVWNRLAARAEALGMASAPELALMEEPVLRLVTRSGMEIAPTLVDGRSYAFVVPGGVDAVRLRSRSSRPSEIVGPFLDDRRRLGVLVGQISVGAGRRRHDYDAHLTADTLSGWHPREDDAPRRWTNGDASLVLDLAETGNRPVFLDIEVLAAGPYRGDGGRPAA
ncbi:MAG: Hint domain-containing protein, partial [Gluconacetobacter diazotrophicus]|nr:Hint domain-containing protein [Gluconacetobacter diazotrophicus]